MNTEMDSAELQVVYEATSVNATVPDTTINVTVGEGAKIEVGEAITYIKSGQAEIGEAVAAGKIVLDNHTTAKIGEFNSNATEKTNAFNSNATDKTTAFNNNATSKTTDFNDNATSKTSDFNSNASDKTTDFNENYTEKKALIDEQVGVAEDYADLAKDWATKTDGKVDGEDYSAKYYAQQIIPIASDITTVSGIASDVTAVAGISTDVSNVSSISSDVSTVSGISSDVTAVAGIDDEVSTVAGIASDVTSVASNSTDISTVASDISNVNAVAGDLTNIDAVNANKTNIDAVASINSDVTTVAGISSNVTTVSGISSDVTSVASNGTDISTVADNISDVNSVATDILKVTAVADDLTNIDAVNANKTNIDAVAGNNSNITAVANNATNINAVAGISSNVTTVAGISSDVSSVASNASNINAVAGDLTNINAVANDLTNIDNASSYANLAKDWATKTTGTVDGSEYSAKYYAEYTESMLSNKADKATTLSGYGITDAYTKTEVDSALSAKANKATTLSGYGITNAYTKTEVDTALSGKQDEITSSNMLSADLVDDASSTNKFVTASDISTWNAKQNALTAGTGIDITSNVISVTSPTLTNKSTTTDCLTILGTATSSTQSTNVGDSSSVSSAYGTALGHHATVSADSPRSTVLGQYASSNGAFGIAIGSQSHATARGAIQIGSGTNSTARSLQVGIAKATGSGSSDVNQYQLLDADGIIPDARISSNIARTSAIPAAQVNSDWNASSGVSEILNKPTLATVATTGAYSDLNGTPTIPTVDQTYDSTSTNAQSGTAVASAISGKANDSDVVKLSGNQNIAGNKTLTGQTYFANGENLYWTQITKGTNPSSTSYKNIFSINDSSYNSGGTWQSMRLAVGELSIDNTGKTDFYFGPYKFAANSGIASLIHCVYDLANNKAYATCPTPVEDTTSSTQIDTVGARNTKLDNTVVKLTGDQTIAGDKTFTGYIKGEAASNTNHAINLGHNQKDYCDFYEYGAVWNFYKSRSNTDTLVAKITETYMQIPTPTEDTTSSVQADTVGARNTKLANYALNTTFTGADGTNAGAKGLVPAPAATDNGKFLKGDGTWGTPSSSSVSWGSITGTLSNQTDLNNALNGKADVDLTNVNASGTSLSAGWAMPSTTYDELTLGASNTDYLAPANGYVFLQISSTAANQSISIYLRNEDNTANMARVTAVATASGQYPCATIAVKKGKYYRVAYTAAGTSKILRFIYATGSESEA